ncbi:hypothetical protein DENSPDRAFT_886194 [Dentipellis sp. KUC8613]|nr:hypothetical protein DENSPDRAFT_886194 [Dentipellis sp. KUC8613]
MIELEDQQRNLDAQSRRKLVTPHEKASLQNKRNQLHHRMRLLQKIQAVYIQGSSALEGEQAAQALHITSTVTNTVGGDNDEWVDGARTPSAVVSKPLGRQHGRGKAGPAPGPPVILWLPSNIPRVMLGSACVPGLTVKEIKLHIGQAEDSLHAI